MASKLKHLILNILVITIVGGDASRILVFFPMPSKSHSILGHGVVNNLLSAGHEVVHVTSFPREKPQQGLKEISLLHLAEKVKSESEKFEIFKLKNIARNKVNIGDSLIFIYFGFEIHKRVFEEQVVLDLLGDPKEKFDAVIVEWFFTDVPAGIAPLFQCPLIWYGSTEAHWQMLQLIDEIPNPSYSVDIFSMSRPPLNFLEKLNELWIVIKKKILYSVLIKPKEKSLHNTLLHDVAKRRNVRLPSYEESLYNGSLLLINSHPSVGTPYRLPQNAKYIGGHHVDKEIKPLPKDLQKIMGEAKHGVIYFSMGSNFKSSDMSDEMKNSLLSMFGKLDQKVIWKFETELRNVPANVHLVKWAPQLSILNHPNLRMFITHGGQLSTIEAVHTAVPVIGIPISADQNVNMRSVVKKGFGITVPLNEDVSSPLYDAINKMLEDKTYKEKAKEVSTIYHDRQKPGEELAYWVEHVVKTHGAPHLRSQAISLYFYEKYYLDMAALILLVGATAVILKRLICKKRDVKQTGQQKQKTS